MMTPQPAAMTDGSELQEEQLTLPAIVDARAAADRERLFGAVTRVDDDDGASGGTVRVRRISYGDMSAATNRGAHWIHQRMGMSTSFKPLAYAGLPDLRYNIMTVAAAKTGHKALLLSSWAPMAAQAKLLEQGECDDLVVAEDDAAVLATTDLITADGKRRVHRFPTLDWLLDNANEAPAYPMRHTLDELRGQDYVVIHTSGSTGAPKLMPYKYHALAALQWLRKPETLLPGCETTHVKDVWTDRCHLLALSPSHAVGVLALGPWVNYYNMPMIMPPADRPLTSDILAQIFSNELCEAAIIAPNYLQSLTRDASRVETLRQLKHLIWTGAPFPSTAVADAVRSRVRIETAFGSTEAALLALVPEHQDNYEWFHFHDIVGCQMHHFSDDLYEQVFVRHSHIDKAQFIFQNLPDRDQFETKDLFSHHPDNKKLWRFRGRRDDIIVLSTGRNVEPGMFEAAVAGHPKVRAALVFGSGQEKPGLIVEAAESLSPNEEHAWREDILATVERANEAMNQHGRISKEMVIFAAPDRPFKRADKGSVQRAKTYAEYDREIKALYVKT